MLTVPEAARWARRDPETIRRWIRGGRLRAGKVGTQHVIEEADLEAALDAAADLLPVPDEWQRTTSGAAQPNWVRLIREDRESH